MNVNKNLNVFARAISKKWLPYNHVDDDKTHKSLSEKIMCIIFCYIFSGTSGLHHLSALQVVVPWRHGAERALRDCAPDRQRKEEVSSEEVLLWGLWQGLHVATKSSTSSHVLSQHKWNTKENHQRLTWHYQHYQHINFASSTLENHVADHRLFLTCALSPLE